MLGEHHSLIKEFPEYKETIHELNNSHTHFAKLYEEYDSLDKEIIRIEEQIETPSDAYTEELKLKRVNLKDQLLSLIKSHS
jgi:uncharacterized protein YdcH (DUF465 family)